MCSPEECVCVKLTLLPHGNYSLPQNEIRDFSHVSLQHGSFCGFKRAKFTAVRRRYLLEEKVCVVMQNKIEFYLQRGAAQLQFIN